MFHHGTTLHGAQSLEPELSKEPLTYYAKSGPLGSVFRAFDAINDDWNVGLVGLGTGTTSCYAKPSQGWTYYEIDPVIEKMAKNDKYFTYLKECKPDANIILGDARLSMRNTENNKYNLIVLDAFSSDAIPTHLLTKEAIEMYFDKLREGGMLAAHISNRYLGLEPVLANIAREKGYVALILSTSPTADENQKIISASQWVIVARNYEDVEPLFFEGNWRLASTDDKVGVWTDDFSNLITILYKPKSWLLRKIIWLSGL